MYWCRPGKHSCQPFCGPEGRFYCSDSVCSLWPTPFSYLCVSVRILCVLKTVCGWTSKNLLLPYACCGLHFIDSAAWVLSFDHSTPLHILISLLTCDEDCVKKHLCLIVSCVSLYRWVHFSRAVLFRLQCHYHITDRTYSLQKITLSVNGADRMITDQ